MKPRILVLIDRFYPIIGGAESQALSLASHLHKNNYGILVLTRQLTKDLKRFEKLNGIPIWRVPSSGFKKFSQYKFALLLPYYLFKFRDEYDIIHCSDIFSVIGLSSIVSAKLLNKKIVGRFTTIGIDNVGLLSKLIKPRILNFLDAAICSSQTVAKEVQNVKIKKSKIFLIRHSLDTSRFKSVSSDEKARLRTKLGLKAKTIVLFAGRLTNIKCPGLLLKAWHMLKNSEYRNHYDSSMLLFLGSGKFQHPSMEEWLKEFAVSQKLTNVKFPGNVYNIDEYYKAADIIIMPSEKDLPANALLEGMLCGLAPIATDIPPNREVIIPDYNGLLFRNLDVKDLFNKLVKLLSNEKLLNKISRNSLKIREKYSSDVIGEKYIELYRKLVSGKK